MPRYIVQHRYASMRDGDRWGPWDAGQPIDLSEADAAWVNTDSPGCLALPEPEPEPEPPTDEDPEPQPERQQTTTVNRQHRSGRTRSPR